MDLAREASQKTRKSRANRLIVFVVIALLIAVMVIAFRNAQHFVTISAQPNEVVEVQHPHMYARVSASIGDQLTPIHGGMNFEDVYLYDVTCKDEVLTSILSEEQNNGSDANPFGITLVNQCNQPVTITVRWFENNLLNMLFNN
jgi:hypothetical protein